MGFKVLYAVTLLYSSLILGYIFKRRGILTQEWSTPITKMVIGLLTPVMCVMVFWALDLTQLRIFTLPLVGAGLIMLAVVPARYLSKWHNLGRKETGSYMICAMFSKVGFSLGAFLCFLLLGEQG